MTSSWKEVVSTFVEWLYGQECASFSFSVSDQCFSISKEQDEFYIHLVGTDYRAAIKKEVVYSLVPEESVFLLGQKGLIARKISDFWDLRTI